MFQLGRTDTIRSCSHDSLEFTKAMLDSNIPTHVKAELLRKAVAAHKQYSNDVSLYSFNLLVTNGLFHR